MAKVTMYGTGNINRISSLLKYKISKSGFSCELKGSTKRELDQSSVELIVFEKYYMRAKNKASLTIMLTQERDTINVDAITSGGGQGPIFNFSWGAEESFIGIVSKILSPEGFSTTPF